MKRILKPLLQCALGCAISLAIVAGFGWVTHDLMDSSYGSSTLMGATCLDPTSHDREQVDVVIDDDLPLEGRSLACNPSSRRREIPPESLKILTWGVPGHGFMVKIRSDAHLPLFDLNLVFSRDQERTACHATGIELSTSIDFVGEVVLNTDRWNEGTLLACHYRLHASRGWSHWFCLDGSFELPLHLAGDPSRWHDEWPGIAISEMVEVPR